MIRIASFFVILSLLGCSPSDPEATTNQASGTNAGSAGSDVTINEAVEGLAPDSGTAAPVTSPLEPPPSEPARPVPTQLPAIVAYVNGEAISGTDVMRAVAELEARAGQPVPPDQRDGVVRGVLDQLIGYRLLMQESLLRGISVPESDIDAKIAELRAQFPSDEAFAETLKLRQMTMAVLRTTTRQGMQVDAILNVELAADITVTPEQVAEFYESNPSQFQQGERVRASHILIGLPENADDIVKDQARVKAADLLGEVEAGRDFAALAKQYSDDPGSGPRGGDLGYFERGQMVPSFEEAAFSLAPAQTSDLVESPFGYHIIKVVDRQAPRSIPLAEVRLQVQQFLEGENRELQAQAFVDALRAQGTVDIYI